MCLKFITRQTPYRPIMNKEQKMKIGIVVLISAMFWPPCLSTMSLNATATGENNGAQICPVMSLGSNITCVTEHSESAAADENGQIWLELSFDNPGCVVYDYVVSGYKTIHLYCVNDDRWYYDKQTVYVGERISGVTTGDADGNIFIPMTSTADILVSYENGSDVVLEIESNTTSTIILRKNMTGKNDSLTLSPADFGGMYGQHAVRVTLTNLLNTVERWLIVAYEEAIAGFVFTGTTAPIVHIGDELHINFTLTSGSEVVVLTEIATMTLIEKCSGDLRSYSLLYKANETGTYNITIVLSNFVSAYNHSFQITVQYPVNNISIIRTEVMMVGDSNPMSFKMESVAMVPMGKVNAYLEIFENFTQALQTNNVSLQTLSPGGTQNENVDAFYGSPGYYLVTATIFSEISEVKFSWLKIVEHEISLDLVALLSVPLSKAVQDIGVTITDPSKSPLYKLNCSFDIDGEMINQTFETVFFGSNATVEYMYNGDGNKTLTVTCVNHLRSWTQTVYVEVYTDCFESTQLFDSVFKNSANPLKVYVTDVTQITGKVVVSDKCKNSTRSYWWDFYDIDWRDRSTATLMSYYNDSANQPQGITISFAKEAIEPGLKKITLTANLTDLDGAVLIDQIFVDFQVPPIAAIIKGGQERMVYDQNQLEVDALSLSSEPYNKVKHIPFNFTWTCRKVADSAANKVDIESGISRFKSPNPWVPFDSTFGADCTGDITNPSAGKATINSADLTAGYWYVFFVNVSKSFLTSSSPSLDISRHDRDVQAIQVVSHQPPDAGIKCRRNCLEKATRDTIITLELQCGVCKAGQTMYQWNVQKFNPSTNSFENLSPAIQQQLLITDINTDTLAIEPKYLQYGGRVKLSCTVTFNGLTGQAAYYVSINEPAYNGTCEIAPEVGYASITYFEIRCKNWRDEGERPGRDFALDYNEPMIYKVYQISNSTSNDTSNAVISETPEPVAKAVLSIGDPNNNYWADVRVKITDVYNGFVEVYLKVQVKNKLKDLMNDTSINMTVDSLIEEMAIFVEQALEDARGTKDSTMIMKAAETIASVVTDFEIVNRTDIRVEDLPTSWQDGLLDATTNGTLKSYKDMLEDIFQKPVDKYQDAAKQAIQNLTEIMYETMQESNSSTFYSVEITANSFANVISNPEYTNDEVAKLVSQALGQLVESFSNLTHDQVSTTAVFTSGTSSLEDTKNGLILLINNVVKATVSGDLHNDSDAVIASQSVADSRMYTDMMAYMVGDRAYALMENSTITPEERVGLFFMRSRIAELQVKKQRELAIVTGTAVDAALESVTQTLLSVTCKGCSDTTTKSNTLVYVQKDTLGEFNAQGLIQDNGTINRIQIGDSYLALTVPEHLINNPDTNYSTVQFSTSILKRNIYIYDSTDIGVLISSPIHKLTMTDANQDPITLALINIYQPTLAELANFFMPFFTPGDASEMFYHVFYYRKIGDYACFRIEQVTPIHVREYTVYLRQETYPTHLTYDLKMSMSYDNDWMTCLPPQYFSGTGLMYFALQPNPIPGEEAFVWTATSNIHLPYYPGTYNISDPRLSPYHLTVITSGCETWNEKSKVWDGTSCQMDWFPAENMISCQCDGKRGMTSGNTFYVPPNTIDFSTVFLKFSPRDQAAVLAMFVLIIVIYMLLMLWGRHQDKKDIVKWGVTPLIDNFSDDTYYYLLTVDTGMRRGAGTKSKIGFIVAGEEYDSGVRELHDGVRDEFPTASVQHFLMATSFPLGDLTYVYIFHDNSGPGALSSWYLNRLDIEDLQTRTRYVFLCGRWLSLDDEDSAIDAILPVCGRENVTTFQNLFYLNTKENLADNHLWVSIFYRPTSSHYSRCQRISCLLLFIMLTMIGNALYFRPEDDFQGTSTVRVGPLQFSWRTVYVSLITTLISTPAVLVAVMLFKKSKVRKISTDVKDTALKYAVPVIDNMMDKWLKESKELERTLVAKGLFGREGTFLPWWFIIIAWVITLGGSFAAAFFVMLFSMEWGKQKTELWLTQFALSFFQSVCVVDPLKVVLMAAVFAMIFIQLEKFKPSGLKRDIILKNYRQRFGKESSIRIPAPPLSSDMLEKARKDRMREVKMMQSIKEIIITLIFLWIIFSISYSNRDHRSYLIHSTVEEHMLNPPSPLQSFNKITTVHDYIRWLRETALPAIFPETEYNNNRLHWRWRQYFSDLNSFRVGPPRIRQLRVPNYTDDIPFVGESIIYPKYNLFKEESKDFCFSWIKPPCDDEKEAYSFSYRAWKFTSPSEIWGIPIAGLYGTYGGGGYIAELDVNWDFSNRTLDELIENLWIDRATRAVFLEMLLYSANSNIFIYCTFITEFPESGGIEKLYTFYPLRIYQHHGATGYYIIFCEICFILFLAALIIRVAYGIYTYRLYYFKCTWRVVDFLGVIGGLVGIAMYVGRLLLANDTMSKFKEDPKSFVNFQHIAIWDLLFVLLLGCLVFLATIRLLGILGYDKRIGQVFKVFNNCAWDLFWFGVLFFYIFLGYCAFGYLLFGRNLESYYNVFESMGTLFISMIGKSKFSEMNEKDPVMAQFYFFTFILLMVYFLLTMFLAMLGESISVVQAQNKVDRSEELVLYLIEKLKDVFGGKKQKSDAKSNFSAVTDSEKPLNLLQELRSELGSVVTNIDGSNELQKKMERKAKEQI